jgi:uncharacterized protein (TIGR00106 family)
MRRDERRGQRADDSERLDRDRAASLADEGGASAAAVDAAAEEAEDEERPEPRAEEPSDERAAKNPGRQGTMLFELSVIPLGGDIHLSDELAQVLEVVESSGLPYLLGPGSTCIEGSWDQVMPVIRACHDRARETSRHVITQVSIEDDEGQRGKLKRNVESVEAKAGHRLQTVTAH